MANNDSAMTDAIRITSNDLRLTVWDMDDASALLNARAVSPLQTHFLGVTPSGDELLLRMTGRRAGHIRVTLLIIGSSRETAVTIEDAEGRELTKAERASFLDLLGWRAFRASQRQRIGRT